jgi:predicted ATP-grasp superfamily ATP-dependent carboligase
MKREIVLVTDGAERASLAVVRSLGAAGCVVHVCSESGHSLAGASRYCRNEHRVPSALHASSAFVEAVRQICTDHEISVLIPVSEAALLALLERRDELQVRIPFTSHATFRHVSDKLSVTAAARRCGIAVPSQEVERLGPLLRYPVVLKPARSVASNDKGAVKLTVRHAQSPEELLGEARHFDARAFPLMLQERIVGPGVGIFVLVWKGELVAAFSHRRLREKPPSGGVSVYRESIAIDPELLQKSLALLAEVAWQGVAMVEYKVAADGTPFLMEINGRFWGSLQLAIDAGVDFPRLLIAASSGEKVLPVTRYSVGARLRWWWGDVDHLLMRLRRSDSELALPPGSPSRWQAVRSFVRPAAQTRNEVWRIDDPRPFIAETIAWLRGVLPWRR